MFLFVCLSYSLPAVATVVGVSWKRKILVSTNQVLSAPQYLNITSISQYLTSISHHKISIYQSQVLPHLNISDLLGGIYSATDGSVDPTGLTTAYARGEQKCKYTNMQISQEWAEKLIWKCFPHVLLPPPLLLRCCVGRCSGPGRMYSHQSVGWRWQGRRRIKFVNTSKVGKCWGQAKDSCCLLM